VHRSDLAKLFAPDDPEVEALRLENRRLKVRIEQMEEGARKLAALEAAGVDNWEGYALAMQEYLND
jgi:hypothetical protein